MTIECINYKNGACRMFGIVPVGGKCNEHGECTCSGDAPQCLMSCAGGSQLSIEWGKRIMSSGYNDGVYEQAEQMLSNIEPVGKDLAFGDALKYAEGGFAVARAGWNGKGTCVIKVCTWFFRHPLVLLNDGATNLPTLIMKTDDGKYVPWLASQTDMLAHDWYVVPVNV